MENKTKRYFLILIFVIGAQFGFSQSKFKFNHSLGGSVASFVKYDYFNFALLVQYNPRLDYLIEENFAISLASFPSISPFRLFYRDPFFIMPLGLQLNLGNCASNNAKSKYGFYLNGGVCDFALGDEYLEIKPFFSTGIKYSRVTIKVDFIPVFNEENATSITSFGFLVNLNRKPSLVEK